MAVTKVPVVGSGQRKERGCLRYQNTIATFPPQIERLTFTCHAANGNACVGLLQLPLGLSHAAVIRPCGQPDGKHTVNTSTLLIWGDPGAHICFQHLYVAI